MLSQRSTWRSAREHCSSNRVMPGCFQNKQNCKTMKRWCASICWFGFLGAAYPQWKWHCLWNGAYKQSKPWWFPLNNMLTNDADQLRRVKTNFKEVMLCRKGIGCNEQARSVACHSHHFRRRPFSWGFFFSFLPFKGPKDLQPFCSQVLNGIFERDDWLEACKLPLGVIPGGTGNGLARWILWRKRDNLAGQS